MKKIYIGMALTDAPVEFRALIQDELKCELRKFPDVEMLDFVGLENGTAVDVYEHDRKCVEECDLMVAICDHASLGLGMEIVYRHSTQKPLLLFAHVDAKVSRMVLGFAEDNGYSFVRYQHMGDVIDFVAKELKKLL